MGREDESKVSRKRKRRAKDKDRKNGKKSRRDSRDKKHKKEKRNKRHSSSSDSSGSDSDGVSNACPTLEERFAMGRRAMQVCRSIVSRYPKLRGEVRELLGKLDGGEGVQIDSIQDKDLQKLLDALLFNLELRFRGGVYMRLEGASSLMSNLAPVLSEPADPSLAEVPLDQFLEEVMGDSARKQSSQIEDKGECEPSCAKDNTPPAAPLNSTISDTDGHPMTMDAPAEEVNAPIDDLEPPVRRVAGPAMPPPEVLAAAAAVTHLRSHYADSDDEDADLIGPPPPEIVEEASLSTEEQRVGEAKRIIAANAAGEDAYAVMGVGPEDDAKDVKKKYWQLSLKVHPDKCKYMHSKEAFDILLKAHKVLQDPNQRALLDEKRQKAEIELVAQRLMEKQRQAAVWRQARGQKPMPGDEELLKLGEDGTAPVKEGRGAWMTELPPERQAGPPSQTNVFAFSQKEVSRRKDEHLWTDTPEQAKARQAEKYLEGYETHLRIEAAEEDMAAKNAAATASVVDEYNQRQRPKSLLEQHQYKLKEKKRVLKKEGQKKKEDWEGQHPWKPWDREKDLIIGAKPKTAKELNLARGTLGDRFGGSNSGKRSFL